MKIKTLAALLAVLGMCLVAGCGGDKTNNTVAPAGPGPSGGNSPGSIPPPAGGAPSGTGPQGTPPPPVSH